MTAKNGELVWLDRSATSATIARPNINFLAKLNLVSRAFDTIGEILDYKKETKRLEVEEQRIAREADFQHQQIDATKQLALEDLKQRSLAVHKLIDGSNERTRADDEGRAIVAAITHLVKAMVAPDSTAETRKTGEVVVEQLIKYRAERLQHDRASFDRIAETVQVFLNQRSNLHGLSRSSEE